MDIPSIDEDIKQIKKLVSLLIAYEELKQGTSIGAYSDTLTQSTLNKLDNFKKKYHLTPKVLLGTLEDMKSKGQLDDIRDEADSLINQLKSLQNKD